MMTKSKLSKLSKMSMPEDKKANLGDLSAGGDDESGEDPAEEASESPDEEAAEGEAGEADESPADSKMLEKVSDEDLIAELKKRGIMKELDEHGGEAGSEHPSDEHGSDSHESPDYQM